MKWKRVKGHRGKKNKETQKAKDTEKNKEIEST